MDLPVLDLDLIASIQAGGNARDKALDQFLTKGAMIDAINYLRGYSTQESDIQDIIQESVIALDRNIRYQKFKQESSLKTYFLSIVHFQYKNHHRKRARQAVESLESVQDSLSAYELPNDYNEKKLVLDKLLTEIGSRCKDLLSLYQLSFSMGEIAKKMKFTSDQVASNEVGKCKTRLKDLILKNPELKEFFNK